jgi:hypothetical protein
VRAGTEDDVKAVFSKFTAAWNAHDLKTIGEILEDSPQLMWITGGAPVWGREAVGSHPACSRLWCLSQRQ